MDNEDYEGGFALGGYMLAGSLKELREHCKKNGMNLTYTNKKGKRVYYTKKELLEQLANTRYKSANKREVNVKPRNYVDAEPKMTAGALHKKQNDYHVYLSKLMEETEKHLMKPHIKKFFS